MKIVNCFGAILLLGGANLFARIASQGIESALAATAVGWSVGRMRAAIKLVRSHP